MYEAVITSISHADSRITINNGYQRVAKSFHTATFIDRIEAILKYSGINNAHNPTYAYIDTMIGDYHQIIVGDIGRGIVLLTHIEPDSTTVNYLVFRGGNIISITDTLSKAVELYNSIPA